MPKYGINKAILLGNVGTKPELRYTKNGHPVCSFRLATNEYRIGADNSRKEVTEWHNITLWRNKALLANDLLKIGSGVYLEGRMQTRSWEGRDGLKRSTTGIDVDTLRLLDTTTDQSAAPSQQVAPVSFQHLESAELLFPTQ